ncbi:Ethanolaminephosphotransferase 1, partial [Papilio machaon]
EPLNGHPEVIPQKLWYLLAAFLFLAYTLDGIDGKQARRTQTSGPLGELFDHGLDSYSVFFIPACLYSIFGRWDFSIPPIRMYYVMWNLLLNFYLSHWEKYNTGVLFLPWGYDFSMWVCTFSLYTSKYINNYTPNFVREELKTNFLSILCLLHIIHITLRLEHNILSYTLRTGKMRSFSEALRPLWSILAIFTVTTLWIHKSSVLPDYDLRAVFLLIGTLFSNVAVSFPLSNFKDTL